MIDKDTLKELIINYWTPTFIRKNAGENYELFIETISEVLEEYYAALETIKFARDIDRVDERLLEFLTKDIGLNISDYEETQIDKRILLSIFTELLKNKGLPSVAKTFAKLYKLPEPTIDVLWSIGYTTFISKYVALKYALDNGYINTNPEIEKALDAVTVVVGGVYYKLRDITPTCTTWGNLSMLDNNVSMDIGMKLDMKTCLSFDPVADKVIVNEGDFNDYAIEQALLSTLTNPDCPLLPTPHFKLVFTPESGKTYDISVLEECRKRIEEFKPAHTVVREFVWEQVSGTSVSWEVYLNWSAIIDVLVSEVETIEDRNEFEEALIVNTSKAFGLDENVKLDSTIISNKSLSYTITQTKDVAVGTSWIAVTDMLSKNDIFEKPTKVTLTSSNSFYYRVGKATGSENPFNNFNGNYQTSSGNSTIYLNKDDCLWIKADSNITVTINEEWEDATFTLDMKYPAPYIYTKTT